MASDGDAVEPRDHYQSASDLFGLTAAAPGETFAAYQGESWRAKRKRYNDAMPGRNLQLEPHPGLRRLYHENGELRDIVKAVKKGKDVEEFLENLHEHLGPDEPEPQGIAAAREMRAVAGGTGRCQRREDEGEDLERCYCEYCSKRWPAG